MLYIIGVYDIFAFHGEKNISYFQFVVRENVVCMCVCYFSILNVSLFKRLCGILVNQNEQNLRIPNSHLAILSMGGLFVFLKRK
jgi:hypothetical protein